MAPNRDNINEEIIHSMIFRYLFTSLIYNCKKRKSNLVDHKQKCNDLHLETDKERMRDIFQASDKPRFAFIAAQKLYIMYSLVMDDK